MSKDYQRRSIVGDFTTAVRSAVCLFIVFKGLNDASDVVNALFDFLCKWIRKGMRFILRYFRIKGAAAPVGYITDSSRINAVENAIRNLPAGDQLGIMRDIEAFRKRKGL